MPDEPTEPDPGYDTSGVPTFDAVREKIEQRFQTSSGAGELDAESAVGLDAEERYEQRRQQAAQRLEEIRRSVHEGES